MKNDKIVIDAISGCVWNRKKNGELRKVGYFGGYRYFCAQIEGTRIYLHRLIYAHFHGPISPNFEIDHINGDGLDNRIENLRTATRTQNQQNRQGAQKNSTTGLRGVYWHKQKNKYMAKIKHNGKDIFLGYFVDPLDAAKAYGKAAAKLHTHNPLAA